MADVDWDSILDVEDKLIDNSDRKQRYHFKSLEMMREAMVYSESIAKFNEDIHSNANFTGSDDCIEIANARLVNALKKLTPKQRQIIELVFWGEMKQEDIAKASKCKQSSVSRLLNRALKKLSDELMK